MRIAKEGLILHMNMNSDLNSTCKDSGFVNFEV